MKRRLLLLCLFSAATLGVTQPAYAQDPVFLWGSVAWPGDFPAVDIKVTLEFNQVPVATYYTDGAGKFAFSSPPSGYSQSRQDYVVVFHYSGRAKRTRVGEDLMQDGQMPTVVLD